MDLEHKAIARLQEAAKLSEFYYQKPLLLTCSGGKDSEVCLELCRRAGVPFEAIHSLTTADAPETVYHVRKVFRRLELEGVKCEILHPRYKGQPTSMWALIPQKLMPPTRTVRYCCQVLKEGCGKNRCVVLGVRSAESQNRSDAGVAERPGKSKREKQVFDFDNGDKGIISPCQMKAKIKIHPIVDWTDRDEIIVLLPDRTAGSVVKALDVLEKKYGRRKFRRTFKTITCDNGSEFADCQGMEHTHYGRGPRTKIYYCHPYSAYERGSNENANGLIRRFFPKGTDFSKVTKKAVRQVQDWMNQYPRKILGWKSAEDMMSIFMSSA